MILSVIDALMSTVPGVSIIVESPEVCGIAPIYFKQIAAGPARPGRAAP